MMESMCRAFLLSVAKAYAKATNLAMSTVSKRFHGADTFLEDFQDGKCSVTLRKFDSMIAEFRKLWPENTDFPKMEFAAPKIKSGKRQKH